ncbi:hypothetical protein DPMN_073190 [Dreissena polymorpha]|uniref:Uncharacterized protein n=1 Tax=Dreissena polymorpha TaxID=45954 RepID=A0A9D4HCX4_DREPO|nr:hypothetical protein DPMN_073190 [Dreissena polymorpha]
MYVETFADMSQQQRAAALLRQAADLLIANTSDRCTQYQHLHQKPLSVALVLQRQCLHPTVKEGEGTCKYRNCGSVSTGLLHPGVIR